MQINSSTHCTSSENNLSGIPARLRDARPDSINSPLADNPAFENKPRSCGGAVLIRVTLSLCVYTHTICIYNSPTRSWCLRPVFLQLRIPCVRACVNQCRKIQDRSIHGAAQPTCVAVGYRFFKRCVHVCVRVCCCVHACVCARARALYRAAVGV